MKPSTMHLRAVLAAHPFGMKHRCQSSAMPRLLLALLAGLAVIGSARLIAAAPVAPPDLIRSNTVNRKLTYNLGATGLRGWIYTKPATYLDSVQGRTTTASRQILVTHVGAGSPADGVMQPDDVILGVRFRATCALLIASAGFPLIR
jgi:hypothetical protein